MRLERVALSGLADGVPQERELAMVEQRVGMKQSLHIPIFGDLPVEVAMQLGVWQSKNLDLLGTSLDVRGRLC